MKILRIFILIAIAVAISVTSFWMGQQSYSWFPSQATTAAKLVDDLFCFLVTLSSFIFFGVIGALLYSIVFSRANRLDTTDGPAIEGNTTVEIVWTVIPVVLIIWIAAYSYDVYRQMGILSPMQVVHLHHPLETEPAYAAGMNEKPDSAEEIGVVAKQWAWSFHYPGRDVTSTELHLPVDRRIRLLMQSEDVIHGFFVPDFRLKQDIIPKRTINFEFTPIRVGKYRLNDSQFSGTYFAAMQADVYVESADVYNQWLDQAANREPVPASNQAASEHIEQPDKLIQSGWKVHPPAPPPVVNHPS
ncbi:MAG: cytochrome c oxidase subunit II [Rhizonema sp. PD38]|nr:cytochrome c oxidase subunit II [Rhizonema sp. PD38]